jgi:hypothetical protein
LKEAWLVGAGFALGWLTTKTWSDPDCRLGLVVFLVITAVLVLVFAIAVTAPRPPGDGPGSEGADDPDSH